MISDSFFMKYVFSVIDDPKEENIFNNDRLKAYYNFKESKNYEKLCNEELISLLDSEN